MPRTDTPFAAFTEADLAPVPAPAHHPRATKHPPFPDPADEDDILAALAAVSSSPVYSLVSTPSSTPSLPHLPFDMPAAPAYQRDVLAAHLVHAPPTNSCPPWAPPQPTQPQAPPQAPPQPHLHHDVPLTSPRQPFTPLPLPDKPDPYAGQLSPVSISQGPADPASTPPAPSDPLCLGTPRKEIRKPRTRKSAPPTPSRFCHICARTQKSAKVFCANLLTDKKCRKAVCEPCFKELNWDFDAARTGRRWLCPHCRGICAAVPRARCHIYTKTNEKRKAVRIWGQ